MKKLKIKRVPSSGAHASIILGGVEYALRLTLRSLVILEEHGGLDALLREVRAGRPMRPSQVLLYALLPSGVVASPEQAGELVAPSDVAGLLGRLMEAVQRSSPPPPPPAPLAAPSSPGSSGPSPSTTAS